MKNTKRIHVRISGSPQLLTLDWAEGMTTEQLLKAVVTTGKIEGDPAALFLFSEDDTELPPEHVFTKAPTGIMVSKCRRVAVEVEGIDESANGEFPPSVPIARLVVWARDQFNMDKDKKYIISLTKDGDALPGAEQIGVYATNCSAKFYFAPSEKIAG